MWIDFKLTNSKDKIYEELINFDQFLCILILEDDPFFYLTLRGDSSTPNITLYEDPNQDTVIMVRNYFKKAIQKKQLLRLENGYIQSL